MASPVQTVDPSISKQPIPLDADDLPTVCVLCSHNCGVRVDVRDGRITEVRPDERNPITHGYICNKGFAIERYVGHEQRVEHPLRRRPDGRFERISWETAIREIAEKLCAIRDEHSPKAIGLVGIGGQGNHMDAAYGLTWLSAVGSERWFNALAQEKHQHWLIDQWMFDAAPQNFFHADQAQAKTLLVMGTNPRISNRGHNANESFKALAEDPERRLIAVDPRETETTRAADRHVRLEPGSDVYFLLGIAATLASSEGLADAAFLEQRTSGFEALRRALEAIDVDEMARRCGIGADEIREVAQELAQAPSAALMWDLALEQNLFSTLISYLIRVILALTGNLGRGGNVFMETATPPHRSPKRFEEPDRALASGIRSIPAMGGFAMFSPSLVPEEVLLDHPERLRALVVEGSNPLLSFSDTARWREACDALDLLVVIEPAMTETARAADYVLPTPVGYEKWEQANFPKGYPEVYVQLRPPVVPGPAQALPEPEIYARLDMTGGARTSKDPLELPMRMRSANDSAQDRLEAFQAGSQIASLQVEETAKLRRLFATQIDAQNAYLGIQEAKATGAAAAFDTWVGNGPTSIRPRARTRAWAPSSGDIAERSSHRRSPPGVRRAPSGDQIAWKIVSSGRRRAVRGPP